MRIDVVRATQLLDSPPEEGFDRLTRLAARVMDVPMAVMTIVDERRQFVKSAVGVGRVGELPVLAFGRHDRAAFIADAGADPDLAASATLRELGAVAYAGSPLVVLGQAIGAISALDRRRRDWTEDEVKLLADVAAALVSKIELRLALRRAREQRAVTEALLESIGDAVLAVDPARTFLLANAAARRVFAKGAEAGQPLPVDWAGLHRSVRLDGEPMASPDGPLGRALRGEQTDGMTFTLQPPGAAEAVWVEASGRPVRDGEGRIIAAVAVYRDVTEKLRRAEQYATVARSIPGAAVALFDRELRCLAIDGGLLREAGIDPQLLVGLPLRAAAGKVEDEAQLDAVDDMCRQAISGDSLTSDHALAGRIFELHAAPVRDALGTVTAGVALALDKTAERRAEAAVQRNEQIYRAMLQHLPNGAVVVVDRDLRYVIADGAMVSSVAERRGYHDLIGQSVTEIASEGNRGAAVAAYRDAFAGRRANLEMSFEGRTLEVHVVPIFEGPQVSHAMAFSYDITDKKREADELRRVRDLLAREHTLLDATLEHIDDGVVLLDQDRNLILANGSYADMFGLPRHALQGMSMAQFIVHVAGMAPDPDGFAERFARQEPVAEFVFTRPRRRILRRSQTPVQLSAGDCVLVTWHDITADRDLLAERERMLLVDPLTGIANRLAAEKALQVEDARRRRGGAPLSVALLDIDHFKRINDAHGHAAGDEVLRRVAATLVREARATDTIARWGGEEFLAVLPGGREGALAFGDRARLAVERLACPGVARVTLSVGVAELGTDEPPARAVARADERLYQAKRGGRNRVEG